MASRYAQHYDDDVLRYRRGEQADIACCDCGLVHTYKFSLSRDGQIIVRIVRAPKETGGVRRAMKRNAEGIFKNGLRSRKVK
jgi:hypothetical protein